MNFSTYRSFKMKTNHIHFLTNFFFLVDQGFELYFNDEFPFTFEICCTQKKINFQCQWCVMLFPMFVVQNGNEQVFGRNINKRKVEMRVGVVVYTL